ncbi:hypothetical protein CLAIMM_03760 [Cladophialophora immunda]|nr:hypothetical protein CLAIMM_03760 [Cladophialophora immunda]
MVHIQPQRSDLPLDGNIKTGSSEAITPDGDGCKVAQSPSLRRDLLHEDYNIVHFQLLYHVGDRLSSDAQQFIPKGQELFKSSVREAFTAAYLMDALIAVAAAHKSTLPGEDQAFYQTEAMRLLTRSLTKFNAQHEITEDYAMAAFLYTMLLGQLVLFDIFSHGEDLASILDRFAHCMKLHHGIRKVVAPVWHKVQPILGGCYLAEWVSDGVPSLGEPNSECSPLWELLGRSDFSASPRQAYSSSIEALQMMFDYTRGRPTNRMMAVQEWLVRVPMDFVDLVSQRRPEALIILAYYAVLLHRARGFWAIGGAGRFLIRSISSYLGEYWLQWLEWPNEVLNGPPALTE